MKTSILLDATVHQRSAATFWRKSSPVHCHLESKLGCLCWVLVVAEWLLARCFHRFWRKTVPKLGMRNDAQVSYQECRSMERRQEFRNQQCKHDHPVKQGILNFHSLIILTITKWKIKWWNSSALFGLKAMASELLNHSILHTPLYQRFFKPHHPVVFFFYES